MNLISKLPKKYQHKVEAILDGSYCDNEDVNYDNEYTSYPCENWKEVLMVARYIQKGFEYEL